MGDSMDNIFDFKAWIQSHQEAPYNIVVESDDCIKLVTDYGEAVINFTEIDEYTIVEFRIISNKDDSVKFYLHFELNDEAHAKQLYDEMVETLINLKEEKTLQILLSCSAGLTTSMFAENLNATVEMLGLDYHFNAVSYLSIYEEANNYDVILIAPQIGYMLKRLQESVPDKPVCQIPTAAFASYNTLATIEFIQKEVEAFNQKKKEKEKKDECTCCCKHKKRILSIVIVVNNGKTQIYYRLYDNCEIIDSNQIIKPSMNVYDLYDIIDTVLVKHGHIDVIGIASPGIVKDNKHLKTPAEGKEIDIKKDFEDRYNIDVFVYNNANAAVVGFSLEHPEYKNIIFHSQPFGVGGQGIISNGKVVKGKNGIAGEVRFFIRRMQLSDDIFKLSWSEHGAVEVVTKSLLPSISIIGPEAVAIYGKMTPDMNEIKNALSSFIDDDYMPEFYYIKEASSYMLSGITELCVNYLED